MNVIADLCAFLSEGDASILMSFLSGPRDKNEVSGEYFCLTFAEGSTVSWLLNFALRTCQEQFIDERRALERKIVLLARAEAAGSEDDLCYGSFVCRTARPGDACEWRFARLDGYCEHRFYMNLHLQEILVIRDQVEVVKELGPGRLF